MAQVQRMLQEADPLAQEDVHVSWKDQQNINAFANLNAAMSDLEDSYEDLKKENDYLDDLEQELELADDSEPVRYRIGDAFVHMSLESAQERLDSERKTIAQDISRVKSEMERVQTQMDELKKVLYARFGKSINLEK
ncbi:hypothetical protein HDU82_000647 [Entophlyctis luteolus]|nr:hypothetical protein HDU82_000647 [Entophlyctis luteolus]KAJ3392947.1 hypothetical protein HDU84_003163 [Entophlyctis sp. JEL0112]